MENHLLNSWKKPEEADSSSNKVTVLASDVYPFRKSHIFFEKIIPSTVIKDGSAYEIIFLDSSMYIDGFVITTYTKEDTINSINLFGEHPNCDLDTNAFCFPDYKKGSPLNTESLSLLLKNFQTYYLDSAYFIPGEDLLKYKKVNSIYIRFNEGDDNGEKERT